MRSETLVCREDQSTGEIGLMFDRVRMIDTPMVSNSGLILAHDLFEHVNGLHSIGSVDDEIEAMGALWYVRGQFGMLNPKSSGHYTPEQSVAQTIGDLCTIYTGGVNFRTPVPNTRPGDCESEFEYIMEEAKKWDEIEQSDQDGRWDDYHKNAIHYLRTGYRKARNKYRDAYMVNNMFWTVADAIDRSGVIHCDIEGAMFKLKYSRDKAYCEEDYHEYY